MSAPTEVKLRKLDRPFEVKSTNDNGMFVGHGSIFDELDSYRDIVVKGAFTKSLREDFQQKGRKVPMLRNHNYDNVIGVYTEIYEDDTGLYVEGQCNMDVQQARETHSLIKQGAMTGLSIGYNTIVSEWNEDALTRKLQEVKLWEVSPVTFPAGDNARAQVKFLSEVGTLSELEDYLRDAYGASRTEAKALAAKLKAVTADPRDAGSEADAASITRTKSILKSLTA
jgi:Escherichia/Staphylococcus phage prohead protease